MKRPPPHNLDPSTTDGQVIRTVNGEATWDDTLPTPSSDGQTLTSDTAEAEGYRWFGAACLLLENGASVPVGTPAGVLIFEKGA